MTPPRYREANLVHYWLIVRKRLPTVAVFTFALALTVTLGTLLMTPWYAATAMIEINPKAPTVFDVGEEVSDLVSIRTTDERRAYYATQYKIIKSRTVVEETLRRLREEHGITDFDEVEDPVETFKKIVELTPEGDTELVQITCEYTDPDKAALFANTLAEVYMDSNLQKASTDSNLALDRLAEQVELYRRRKFQSEEALVKYRFENGLVGIEQQETAVQDSLKRLQTEHSTAVANRLKVEADLAELRTLLREERWGGLAVHLADEDPVLEQSLTELAVLQQQRAALASRYKDGHPDMQRMDGQIAQLDKTVRSQLASYVQGVEAELALAKGREQALAEQLDATKVDLQGIEERSLQLSFLHTKATLDESFFQELERRIAEVDLSNFMRANNVRFVDKAIANPDPVRPLLTTNVPIALAVGLLGGLALAFFLEYIDSTVKTREDIEDDVGVPFLGAIPQIEPGDITGLEPGVQRNIYVHTRPRSPIAESLRSIRTNILFRSPDRPIRRLLVTSAAPQEGKSFVSSNLAAIIAMQGTRILVIDADLRRPTQHKLFDRPNERGLTNVLSGELTLKEAVMHTPVPGMDLLVAGPNPGNPAELLGHERFQRLLDSIVGYDMILIDSPPVGAVADPLVLSRLVDGVVMVVRSNQTPKDLVVQCRSRLGEMDARILGAVANRLDVRRSGYGYYYYYDYNSAYYAEKESAAG